MKEQLNTHHPSPITHHAVEQAASMTPLLRIAIVGLLVLLGGCTDFNYYLQSVYGQIDIFRRERSIEEVTTDPVAPDVLKRRLTKILDMRAFASRELGLPDNRSYRIYADLERPFVVLNVFAAPEFSVRPVQWCFLLVGCVSYRGFFAKEEAQGFAAELAGEGYDVYLGPVPAYSTLGWFPDPVLNTFVHYPDTEIARLLFHELSHQVVYVRDDTVFNESFAVAVELEGVRRWLARSGDAKQQAAFEHHQRIRAEFARLVRKHRERLDALYRSGLESAAMRVRKGELLRGLEQEYQALKQGPWDGFAGFDPWFARRPNNAQLASVAIYTQMVPAFRALLRREGNDLPRFYAAVKELGALPKEERNARLIELAPQLADEPSVAGERRARKK